MEKLKEVLYGEIEGFRKVGHQFINGELNLMQFKHASGALGVYAHKGGKDFMIRLRIPSGITNVSEMNKVYEFTKKIWIRNNSLYYPSSNSTSWIINR